MKQEFRISTQRETHINNILASIFAPNFRAVLTFMLTQTYNSHSKGKQNIYFDPKYKWTWHVPGTQIQVVPNSVLQSSNDSQTSYGNRGKKWINILS